MTYGEPLSPARRFGRGFARVVAVVLVVVVLAVVALLFYSNLVMRGERAQAVKVWTDPAVSVTDLDDAIVLSPAGAANGTGLVFIPGAKVDPFAYMYKLSGIVEQGVTVVITKPTLNLAFFDTRPLSDFTADAPQVTTWYVGGHSLGGVRACQLADAPEVAGLVLFGSYCANDLSHTGLHALSISGSNDGLSTPAKIAAAKPELPADATYVVIAGANHAAFGDYGVQPGDGVATVTSEHVRAEITDALAAFFG